jgi:dolichol kinase
LRNIHSPVARAFIHTSLGVILTLAVLLLGKDLAAAVSAVAAAVLLIIEWLRFRSIAVNRWLMARLVLFFREEEVNRLTGATFYMIGSGLTLAFFPAEIAITAILFLAIGDPVAALVGKWKGKHRFWGKSLEGNLCCLVVCLLIGLLSSQFQRDLSVTVAVTGAVFAFIFETLPWPVNDNITIPVGSAAAMMVLQSLLQA